jgi:thiol-disulfide isomerase/thioredoxin
MKRVARLLFAFPLLLAPAALAASAPKVAEPLTASAVPAAPYDESADAHADVARAIAAAQAGHKFVLIDFGGNWCPDCRVTAGVLGLPSVQPWLGQTFVPVMVDVGRMKKNLDIAAAYGVRITAVPTIVVLDDKGHILNAGNPAALSDARSMSPQAIVDTLNGWISHG